MADTITAYRGQEQKTFSIDTWNDLPEDKYGWKKHADEPEEVTALKVQGDTTELPVSNETTQLGKEHKPKASKNKPK
jgi:hypothetical protein